MPGLGSKCVVFDFDLTLADSSVPAADCIRYALSNMGRPDVSVAQAHATIGLSLSKTFKALTEEEDLAEATRFGQLFLERAESVMVAQSELFDSTVPTLEELARRGLGLGIASTKDRHMIVGILERFSLHEAFGIILGGDDVGKRKPDPEGLHLALESLGSSTSEALFVGDSVTDAETARRAGVPFVAVLSGVTPREAFSQYRPSRVLHSLDELLVHL